MAENPTPPQLYSESAIAEILDRLIDAKAEVDEQRRVVAEYQNSSERPDMPPSKSFEDTASLAKYVNAWTKYNNSLSIARLQQTNSEQRLYELEAEVKNFLPLDAHVFHSYGIRDLEYSDRGGRYQITHRAEGTIQVIPANY